jgi:hypothetical protein
VPTVSEIDVLAVVVPEVPVIVMVFVPVATVELALRVRTLVPLVGFVPKDPVTPVGSPATARFTLPVNPPTSVTVMVSVALPPCATDRLVGKADSVKPALGFTVSSMVVLAVVEPLVPMMVSVDILVAAVADAHTVIKLVAVVGLVPNVAVTPLGKPLTAKVTAPVKLPIGVNVTVVVPHPPTGTTKGGEIPMEKPEIGLTVRSMGVECISDPLFPVIVNGKLPAGVEEPVETDRVEVPELLIDEGLNAAVAPLGRPLTLRLTVPLNPFVAVTATA